MFSIPHIVVIFVVALVVFGPEKLPELARTLGKVMGEFRRATGDLQSTFEGHMRDIERDAETRRIGGTATAAPDGQSSGVPGDAGSANALPAATPHDPAMSAAEGIVPSNPPNAAALAERKGMEIFAGEAESVEPVVADTAAELPSLAGSSEPERTPEHTYDHVSDAGSRQS
jgi:TatA/E family protein of Tat protein translocase